MPCSRKSRRSDWGLETVSGLMEPFFFSFGAAGGGGGGSALDVCCVSASAREERVVEKVRRACGILSWRVHLRHCATGRALRSMTMMTMGEQLEDGEVIAWERELGDGILDAKPQLCGESSSPPSRHKDIHLEHQHSLTSLLPIMASKRAAVPARHLFNGFRATQHRTMATEAPLPTTTTAASPSSIPPGRPGPYRHPPNPFLKTATCTTHAFPSLEPTTFVQYPSTHLLLPLRKDILHRAVVYEGDMTRQGTASTKWRSEVHGSNRKIRPQKGTGAARLGDKKSPMLKGGGVAFGPKPRDFSTGLQKKVYDLAWRTALSYRYKKGELVVLEDLAEITGVHQNSMERYVRDMLRHNRFGNPDGRTLFVTLERREAFFTALEAENMGREARALDVLDVDVKDLLELGRVVIERPALEHLFEEHETDLRPDERLGKWARRAVLEYWNEMGRRGGAIAEA
jgi:large subunit ribosomal protein L4